MSFLYYCTLAGLWFWHPSATLSVPAWHLALIFFGTIYGIILQLFPLGGLAILALSASTMTGTLTINQALSAFGSQIAWLIFASFLLAKGFIKTGLGTRIAYYFIQLFGKSTLGLSYSLVASETLLSPVTPSNTSRGAGVLFPVIRSLSREFGSDPAQGTERKLGAFLMVLGYQTNVVTSALFITASAANPVVCQILQKLGISITWTLWAKAALLPGLVGLGVFPYVLYRIFPPLLKKTPEAPEFAAERLRQMGPMTRGEGTMLGTFGILLGLWIFGPGYQIDATSTALLGLSILLLTRVLTWDDLLNETGAWNTLIWMGTLIMMCQFLSELGFIPWVGEHIGSALSGWGWLSVLIAMNAINFFIHYLFASTTAHASALLATLVTVAVAAGVPPLLAALSLAFTTNLCASLTHYGTGPGPVYFGAGYVSLKDWWRAGAILGGVQLLIWGTLGVLWWKGLGLW